MPGLLLSLSLFRVSSTELPVPRKISFLTLFFIVLGGLLAVAIVLRVRAYQVADELVPTLAPVTTTEAADPQRPHGVIVSNEGITPVVNAAEPQATSTTESRVALVARARQERYNELLRAGVPPAAAQTTVENENAQPVATIVAPPKKEPSLIKRVVTPIANALGLGRSDPPPSSASAKPSPQQKSEKPEDTEPPDAESDIRPPQLMTIEFTPNQVQDNQTTTLSATVIDDLSGVQMVSGVIASPTGGLQGFACQREGETNRYVAQVKVPAEAAEGIWRVNYLTLSDNARNSVNLAAAQGMLPPSASFVVTSSNSDSLGPTLKAVWLDRQVMKAGERNVMFVEAEDEKSGVGSVSGVLLSPSRNARFGFGCQLNGQGVWECPITPPTCLDCGLWTLEQIQLGDKATNMATFRNDNALVKNIHLDISADQCDSQPPQLTSVTLDTLVVSNAEANTILARAVVGDDICGVANLSGQAAGPGAGPTAPRLYFSFEKQGESWVARISVPKHAARGLWKIVWVQVLDAGHNLKAYSERDPALAGVTFRVN